MSSLDESNGPVSTFTDLAAIVRFSTVANGSIDAINGSAYGVTNAVPYSAGTSYHIEMDINVTSGTYSVYVTPLGESRILLANNILFRSTQTGVTTLNYFAVYGDDGTATHSNIEILLDATPRQLRPKSDSDP